VSSIQNGVLFDDSGTGALPATADPSPDCGGIFAPKWYAFVCGDIPVDILFMLFLWFAARINVGLELSTIERCGLELVERAAAAAAATSSVGLSSMPPLPT